MSRPAIHIRFRKNLVSCMSLAMIALFMAIGIFAQQTTTSKRSALLVVEKSKKAASENDFLLFEEDNELSDENESGDEWSRDFSFCPLSAVLPETQIIPYFSNSRPVFGYASSTLQPTPLFLRIRSLRI